jgi:hypothetical protein
MSPFSHVSQEQGSILTGCLLLIFGVMLLPGSLLMIVSPS